MLIFLLSIHLYLVCTQKYVDADSNDPHAHDLSNALHLKEHLFRSILVMFPLEKLQIAYIFHLFLNLSFRLVPYEAALALLDLVMVYPDHSLSVFATESDYH